MDAGYGTDTALRANITELGLSYVAGILPQTSVWAPGTGPRPPKKWSGNGRPPKLLRRDSKTPTDFGQEACDRSASACLVEDHVARRYGGTLVFARCSCARPSSTSRLLARRKPAGGMAADRIARGRGSTEPIIGFSTLPASIGIRQLVDITKLRWPIERDYHELKQEVGFGHLEGRGLARLPPSRNAVHRGLRIPDLKARNNFSLSNSRPQNLQGSYYSQKLSAEGIRHCGLNVAFQIRLRPSDED